MKSYSGTGGVLGRGAILLGLGLLGALELRGQSTEGSPAQNASAGPIQIEVIGPGDSRPSADDGAESPEGRAPRRARGERPERGEREEREEREDEPERREAEGRGPEGRGPEGRRGFGGRGGFDPVLAALDANGDGRLNAAEIDAAPTALLKLDGDASGDISAEEMRPPGRRRGGEGFGGPEGGRGGPGEGGFGEGFRGRRGRGPGGGGRDESAAALERLWAFDKNQDEFLTGDELPTRMKALLTRADKNNDQKLSREELATTLQTRSEE